MLSDAELVTMSTIQALLGFTSEARCIRYAHDHLRHLFPYVPDRPGYNKRSVTRLICSATSPDGSPRRARHGAT